MSECCDKYLSSTKGQALKSVGAFYPLQSLHSDRLHLHELHALSGLEEYNSIADDTMLSHPPISQRLHLTGTSVRNSPSCEPQETQYELFRSSMEFMRDVLKWDIYDLFFPESQSTRPVHRIPTFEKSRAL
ncbi:unnamed protein product [Clonostachys rhizophaga]|uniref:Uncharacterized protein n=1 Tax=Clonostachys rhizophaga TaxID=160324 RepID=A0A9N9YMF2_9HYPO|nr:unnamed protein product [Clonostachys rhizophaga]